MVVVNYVIFCGFLKNVFDLFVVVVVVVVVVVGVVVVVEVVVLVVVGVVVFGFMFFGRGFCIFMWGFIFLIGFCFLSGCLLKFSVVGVCLWNLICIVVLVGLGVWIFCIGFCFLIWLIVWFDCWKFMCKLFLCMFCWLDMFMFYWLNIEVGWE